MELILLQLLRKKKEQIWEKKINVIKTTPLRLINVKYVK